MNLLQERQSSDRKSPHRAYYEDIIASSDIEQVAWDLIPDRIADKSGDTLLCDCPNHASISKTSLHIDTNKQLWHCWGCCEGGDVIQFVEFVQSGQVSKGIKGSQPLSHRQARDYLASTAKMPLLGKADLTPEEIANIERNQQKNARTYQCLTAIAEYYRERLIKDDNALTWFLGRYAVSKETVSDLKIGLSIDDPGGPSLMDSLLSQGFTHEEVLSTGVFVKTGGGPVPFFQGRITFPYWSRGRGAVYMIARKTPWTPENEHEKPKYKKLLVHSQRHPYVRECIDNSAQYNEDCLSGSPSTLIITEGITDAIATVERGYMVISPVTVRFKHVDQERLRRHLKGFGGKVIFVQDNELSQVGLRGAVETAAMLCMSGIDARIAELPLGDGQTKARDALLERYGIDGSTSAADRNQRLKELSSEQQGEVQDLLEQAKIDLNDYWKAGHTKEEFEQILMAARNPLERAISDLNPSSNAVERSEALDVILWHVSRLDPSQQEYHLRRTKERLGDVSLEALKKHLAQVTKNDPESSDEEKTKFEKLVNLFHESGSTAFLDQYGHGWATMKIGGHYENVPIQSSKFVRLMLDMYVTVYEQPVAVDAIKLVGELLTARAAEARYLYNRYAWIEDRLFIDMGRPDWKVIEVTARGWNIVQPEKPVFKRFSHQRPMPEPKKGGDLRKILIYLAVKDEGNKALLLVWLCTCMLEHLPRPGLNIHGIQGSCKTSAAEFLRWTVDPSITLTNSLSKDLTEFVQLMDHHAVVSLDNLSSIPSWASDALCRATTGGGYQKRQLYSDDEDVTYYFRRVFILNGISVPATAPDLLDRSISIEFTRIEKKQRQKISKLRKDFEADLPDILGGILDVMVKVIARRDEELEEHPRLADWYGLGYVAADVLGVKDAFVKAFNTSEAQQHREVVESHVVSELLLEFLEDKDTWEGRTSDLYADLTKIAEERRIKKEWPKSASVFGKKLKKLTHNLAEVGIVVRDGRDGKARRISVTKTEVVAGDDTTESFSAKSKIIGGFPVTRVMPSCANDTRNIDMTGTHNAPVTAAVTCCHNVPADGLAPSHESASPGVPPLPSEVQAWNDSLQELFCVLSIAHQDEGMGSEKADSLAVEQVKKSESFRLWGKDITGNA
jgi:DNA primase